MQLDPVRLDSVSRYEDLGVDNLIVYPLPLENVADVATFLDHHARFIRR